MSTEEIAAKQLRSENIIVLNETLVKVGIVFFLGALYWSVLLAISNQLDLTSRSLYVIIGYIVLLMISSRTTRHHRAYSDAAEIMLQFDTQDDRQRYYDEKLRPQFL